MSTNAGGIREAVLESNVNVPNDGSFTVVGHVRFFAVENGTTYKYDMAGTFLMNDLPIISACVWA